MSAAKHTPELPRLTPQQLTAAGQHHGVIDDVACPRCSRVGMPDESIGPGSFYCKDCKIEYSYCVRHNCVYVCGKRTTSCDDCTRDRTQPTWRDQMLREIEVKSSANTKQKQPLKETESKHEPNPSFLYVRHLTDAQVKQASTTHGLLQNVECPKCGRVGQRQHAEDPLLSSCVTCRATYSYCVRHKVTFMTSDRNSDVGCHQCARESRTQTPWKTCTLRALAAAKRDLGEPHLVQERMEDVRRQTHEEWCNAMVTLAKQYMQHHSTPLLAQKQDEQLTELRRVLEKMCLL